jgi:hypothetical protein
MIRKRRALGGGLPAVDGREAVLLVLLIFVPAMLIWRFASDSFFIQDDIYNLFWAHDSRAGLSFLFDPIYAPGGRIEPADRLSYLALDWLAPMNFHAALAYLVACQAVSAVLLQRILALLFGHVWWTYALAFAWVISVIYLGEFDYFAAGAHSIPSLTATLASIHGYLRWRAGGRRAWIVWSLAAMIIALTFYVKALLIPLYLLLMRILLLDPASGIRDSLRSVRDERAVWVAYTVICAVYLLVYWLGPYQGVDTAAGVSDIDHYLRVLWLQGFWPMVLGVRIPPAPREDWHHVVVVAVQLALVAVVVLSIARRRSAWRAWAFLVAGLLANALIVYPRVSIYGSEAIAFQVHYLTESALLVPLALAFAFAVPARTANASHPGKPTSGGTRLRLPGTRAEFAVLATLAAYLAVTLITTRDLSGPFSDVRFRFDHIANEAESGRLSREYFDNLRADLDRADRQEAVLDTDVPEWIVSGFLNLAEAEQDGRRPRYTLLSSILPLFGEQVAFNRPDPLRFARRDGHLAATRFFPASSGSPAELTRQGRLWVSLATVTDPRNELCARWRGPGAFVAWAPERQHTRADWWLRVLYRSRPAEPVYLQSNSGLGWGDEPSPLPPMTRTGTALAALTESPFGPPTIAGVRLLIPEHGRICLSSLEIGRLDPPIPAATGGGAAPPSN